MSISDLLNSGGGKTFKFDTIGATITGPVTSAEVVQKKNFDTGELEFWSDGKPVQQIRVSIQTDQRDPADPEDDGIRNVYIKGWGDQLRALRTALATSGAKDVIPGGTFTATYTGDGQLPPGKRGFPPKLYAYSYTPPSSTAGLLNQQQGVMSTPAPQQPTQPPAQAAAPAPVSVTQAAPQASPDAALAGLNLTPEQLAAVQAMQNQG